MGYAFISYSNKNQFEADSMRELFKKIILMYGWHHMIFPLAVNMQR